MLQIGDVDAVSSAVDYQYVTMASDKSWASFDDELVVDSLSVEMMPSAADFAVANLTRMIVHSCCL